MLSEPLPAALRPPEPLGADLLSHWLLDPSVTYLNHGHFGGVTRAVLEAQFEWRRRIESNPIELLERRRNELLEQARRSLGAFIGAEPANLGFVTNTTNGVNAVVRSIGFEPGDELLTTNHVYNAVRQTMRHVAERAGATFIEAPVPVPIDSPRQVIEAIDRALTDRTRLLAVSHITSPTAVRFPLEGIIELCTQRGVDVLVDGAHAPGMVELDLERTAASYYVGNLHKWVCAPKGSAFLWVRPDRQPGIHPTTISHYLDQGFAEEFSWQGTRDITGWLCVGEAIDFMARFGWDRVRRHNHELAVWTQALLCERWSVEPITPADGSMIGSMTTVPLPEGARRYGSVVDFQAALLERHHIEVPIIDWDHRWFVRASCQIYNTPPQYERLAEAVLEVVGGSDQ